jgi:hypothetical protein
MAASRVPDLGDRALNVLDRQGMSLIADLDGKSKKALKSKKDWELVDAVRGGRFDAEFVFRIAGSLAWAYYDTNNDGTYDRVMVSLPGDPMRVGAAFTFDRKGVVTADTTMVGKPMFQPDAFKNKAHRKALADVKAKTVDARRF